MFRTKSISFLQNKRICVTGGAGSIGSEIVRQLCKNNKVFILDVSENAYGLSQELSQKGYWVKPRVGDIRNKDTVEDLFADFKPQVVIHAAAYKEVPAMEIYPDEAIQTNIYGTHIVLHEAQKYECLENFIYISTDKVVNAKSMMGITKKAGELLVKNLGGVCVRFGNVAASRASVLEIWRRQFENGEPLTVTDPKMERYIMDIPQACSLVLKAGKEANGGEIWIMDMGDKIKIGTLCRIFLLAKGKPDYPIKIIGIRPGETMEEKLMTKEEEETAVKKGKFWVIK